MFIITEIKDFVRVPPEDLRLPTLEVIEDLINQKFTNKVIPQAGLAISVFDILDLGEGTIVQGSDGFARYQVRFRLQMFRPHAGECLVGKISGCTTRGLRISMDFCKEIFIPRENFREEFRFDETEKTWYWQVAENKLYLDVDELVRFRVVDVTYGKPPMQITGQLQEDGLGCLTWWQTAHQIADDDDEPEPEAEAEADDME
eukprot:TRINITY_DN6251_c0_g1_i1.p1 TRINITY_DN6251_c0_g1~~TRINITY_DN6251_c0_g1_i1.p1  ORF type:complete len:202 (-),score=27.73 TRINITY_DN6251_c0_g1_i1:1035-1640(-)